MRTFSMSDESTLSTEASGDTRCRSAVTKHTHTCARARALDAMQHCSALVLPTEQRQVLDALQRGQCALRGQRRLQHRLQQLAQPRRRVGSQRSLVRSLCHSRDDRHTHERVRQHAPPLPAGDPRSRCDRSSVMRLPRAADRQATARTVAHKIREQLARRDEQHVAEARHQQVHRSLCDLQLHQRVSHRRCRTATRSARVSRQRRTTRRAVRRRHSRVVV